MQRVHKRWLIKHQRLNVRENFLRLQAPQNLPSYCTNMCSQVFLNSLDAAASKPNVREASKGSEMPFYCLNLIEFGIGFNTKIIISIFTFYFAFTHERAV